MIRYMTAGESHGETLLVIIEGLPAGLALDEGKIDHELKRRMAGYGRGGRMKIENDTARVVSGVRKGVTIGSPVAILVANRDFSIDRLPSITKARPGHADLAGGMKYNSRDLRDILERASARETAARVAAGAVAKIFLSEFGVDILSHVVSIGGVQASVDGLGFAKIRTLAERSELRCADKKAEDKMKRLIDRTGKEGDSLGGVCEILIRGVVPGIGTHVHWDRRLDGNLARCLMAIPAVKGVEFGAGFRLAELKGSEAHDEIFYDKQSGFKRRTNNAGGLEGGMTNGDMISVKIAMKPIATLMRPLASVDIATKKATKAQVERADICAVPACGVVGEAVSAIELASALQEKFGGDSLGEISRNFAAYKKQISDY